MLRRVIDYFKKANARIIEITEFETEAQQMKEKFFAEVAKVIN